MSEQVMIWIRCLGCNKVSQVQLLPPVPQDGTRMACDHCKNYAKHNYAEEIQALK
jgi:hypothetical protein